MAALNGVLAPPPLAVSQWTPPWRHVQLARFSFTLETVEILTGEKKKKKKKPALFLFGPLRLLLTRALFFFCLLRLLLLQSDASVVGLNCVN